MRFHARRLFALASAVLIGASLTACSDDSPTEPTPQPPAVPTGVSATSTGTTSIRVVWNQVSGAASYEVDRAEGSGALSSYKTGLTATFLEDTGLKEGTQYRYVVRAVDGSLKSGNSSETSATTGTTPPPAPKVATVTGVPLSRTFFADTTYILQGYVKVSNGATLTIQPGTKIVGDTLVPGSSLWVLRGSKIMAEGTAAAPIVFTSQRAEGNRAPGDWGGLVIVGNAPINRTANPIFTEGYQGRGQFLIALQTSVLTPRPGTGTVSSDPRGFEGDGCENDKAGCTYANAPYTMPVFANFTVVGPGTGVFSGTDGNAAVVRRGGAASFVNGILSR